MIGRQPKKESKNQIKNKKTYLIYMFHFYSSLSRHNQRSRKLKGKRSSLIVCLLVSSFLPYPIYFIRLSTVCILVLSFSMNMKNERAGTPC